MDPSKISSILNWPTPRFVKVVWGFLGLTWYYRHFIKDYGKIAYPLIQLPYKEHNATFHWPSQAQQAFVELQQVVTTVPVLAVPNLNKQFTLECDASSRGLGAVLM